MDNINIKNGIIVARNNTYSMYHLYLPDASDFYMYIPNKTYDTYKILIDFPDIKSSYSKKDEEISKSNKEKADKVYTKFPNSIYLLSPISLKEFTDAIEQNDDKIYKKLIQRIETCRNNAYWSLVNSQIFEDTINVEPEINIIEQTKNDVKLFWYLDINGISNYKQVNTNPIPKVEPKKPSSYIVFEQKPEMVFIPKVEVTSPKPKNKNTIPKGDGVHSTGYSNIAFILTVLVISLVMGTCLAYLILR